MPTLIERRPTLDLARDVASMADGVVLGSAIVRMIGELGDTPDWRNPMEHTRSFPRKIM